jgi:roadblock/LC7 domain-containing protein
MVDLERFLKINGVVAAGEFTPMGVCKNHVGKVTMENAEALSNYSATIEKLLESMGGMLGKMKVLDLDPLHGFVHCGGKFTLFAGKKYYAVADGSADWNEVSWAVLKGKFPK